MCWKRSGSCDTDMCFHIHIPRTATSREKWKLSPLVHLMYTNVYRLLLPEVIAAYSTHIDNKVLQKTYNVSWSWKPEEIGKQSYRRTHRNTSHNVSCARPIGSNVTFGDEAVYKHGLCALAPALKTLLNFFFIEIKTWNLRKGIGLRKKYRYFHHFLLQSSLYMTLFSSGVFASFNSLCLRSSSTDQVTVVIGDY